MSIDESDYYPDTVVVDASGRLYIGSAATGAVIRTSADAVPDDEVFAIATGVATLGMAIDEVNGRLWRCRTDLTGSTPSAMEVIDLERGSVITSHALPPAAFCNGLTLDSASNAYATDSLGQHIYRVRSQNALVPDSSEVWSEVTTTTPSGQFGLNGIAFDGDATIYASDITAGSIYSVPIAADGSAEAARELVVAEPFSNPDGISFASGSLVVTEFASGEVSRVDPSDAVGRIHQVARGLDAPTSVAAFQGSLWVVESQADHLLDASLGPAQPPFKVRAIDAP